MYKLDAIYYSVKPWVHIPNSNHRGIFVRNFFKKAKKQKKKTGAEETAQTVQ